MAERFVYFDNINTTFPDSAVIEVLNEALTSRAGNPSSHIHSAGISAARILDQARGQVASLIGADASSIIFTSGSTEANNLAISGFIKANQNHQLVVSSIEHFSILNQANRLKRNGQKVTFLDVDQGGLVITEQLEAALKAGPALVSIAMANPEIGVIQDITQIGEICRKYGATFHCDATTAAAMLEIDIKAQNIDLLTLSGHNMYAPVGVGALYAGKQIAALFEGGNQEMGLRPGTENFAGAASMGKACELIAQNRVQWDKELTRLGQRLWDGLAAKIPFIHFTGHATKRLPGHVSFWVEHIEGESLLLLLNMKGVMASSGSACSSNLKGRDEEDLVASHVLTAIGVPNDICAGSITFSLSKYNTESDVDYVIEITPGIVEKLLAMSPSYSDYMRKKGVIR
ncbi:MAG TPA: cysteine desulfurase [candidate division Zixibacteria bacterium]|nr:cysteine desulfurase [candidate division Zixibacteria bacterium]